MRRKERAATLIEVVVAVALLGFVFLVVSEALTHVLKQVNVLAERYTMYSEISYAFDDFSARAHAAARLETDSYFNSAGGTKDETEFLGEKDMFNVTPETLADNDWYRYFIDPDTKDFVREQRSDGKQEVLVEGKFNPKVVFEYKHGDEPNLMVVKINATSARYAAGGMSKTISRLGTVRFWFANIVK